MDPNRIGPVGRARGEYAHELIFWNAARVHLQRLAVAEMQPGEDENLGVHFKALDALMVSGEDFQPRLGRALRSLARCILPAHQRRTYGADRMKVVWILGGHIYPA